MSMPAWALTLAYWLHMLATVVWIGGLTALALVVLPAASRVLEDRAFASLLEDMQRRLDALGWFCLIILVATGLFQMSANPNYQDFLTIGNRWALAILIKHLVFFLMVGVSAYLTWGVLPDLRRTTLRIVKAKDASDERELQRLHESNRASARLLRINLILAVVVLALTAVARAS